MPVVLLIAILAATLPADAATVVETKSGSGFNQLFYSFDVPASPGPVTAMIKGSADCNFCGNPNNPPTSAGIDLSLDLYTAGPARDGIAYLQLDISQSGGVSANVSGAIGSHALGGCPSELDCVLFGFFPFELGVPATIHLSGLALAYPNNSAGFLATASLQLYELPTQEGDRVGAPVQISLVPEPGSAGLAFTGLSALILLAFRRKRNLPLV